MGSVDDGAAPACGLDVDEAAAAPVAAAARALALAAASAAVQVQGAGVFEDITADGDADPQSAASDLVGVSIMLDATLAPTHVDAERAALRTAGRPRTRSTARLSPSTRRVLRKGRSTWMQRPPCMPSAGGWRWRSMRPTSSRWARSRMHASGRDGLRRGLRCESRLRRGMRRGLRRGLRCGDGLRRGLRSGCGR